MKFIQNIYIFSTQYFSELRNMATKLGRSLVPGPSVTRKHDGHVTRMCQISGGVGRGKEGEGLPRRREILCFCAHISHLTRCFAGQNSHFDFLIILMFLCNNIFYYKNISSIFYINMVTSHYKFVKSNNCFI
jgi:hypothetical protein